MRICFSSADLYTPILCPLFGIMQVFLYWAHEYGAGPQTELTRITRASLHLDSRSTCKLWAKSRSVMSQQQEWWPSIPATTQRSKFGPKTLSFSTLQTELHVSKPGVEKIEEIWLLKRFPIMRVWVQHSVQKQFNYSDGKVSNIYINLAHLGWWK